MSKRRLILDSGHEETVIILKDALFYPVILRLPDELKESMPATKFMAIDKRHVMRFFNVPSRDDLINFSGHIWRVLGMSHTPRLKGSPAQNHCPEIITQYIGAIKE